MSWITVDIDLPKHPKLAELPNDTARFGWLAVLCEAKRQRNAGAFASDRHFREVLGRFGKYLPDYLAARLLERHEDGSLAVHGWQQYQWAVKKQRQRGDIEGTLGGQKGAKKGTDTDTYTDTDTSSLRVRTSPTSAREILGMVAEKAAKLKEAG